MLVGTPNEALDEVPARGTAAAPPCAAPAPAGAPPAGPSASVGRTVARNVAWNWAGTATNMLCGFVTVPYLLANLGQEGYSLWILVASLSGYFDLLDLGVRPSMGRNLAFRHARGDREGVNAVFNTGLALLFGAAALVVLGTLGVLHVFTHLFAVPAAEVGPTRLALLLVGLNLAVYFPLFAFEAVLWAYQRFDCINGIDIPVVLLRTGLTFALVKGDGGLVTLGAITLGVTCLGGLGKIVLARRVEPGLRLRPRYVRREAARGLFGFGVWCVLMQVARVVTLRAGEPIVGNRLGVALVAPFSVSARLVGYANNVLCQTTGVLTPLATALHARGRYTQQQALFVQGGKFCLALALLFFGLFAFLGRPLLELWTHGGLPLAYPVLLVLILGEVIPMSQWVTFSMVLGMDRHRLWACMGILEAVGVITLALTVGQAHGLVGVAVTVAGPAALCRGLVPMVYGCRILAVPLRRYALRAVLPAAVAAVLPAAGLALFTAWHVPGNWFELIACGFVYCLIFVAVAVALLVGVRPVLAHGAALLRGAPSGRAEVG